MPILATTSEIPGLLSALDSCRDLIHDKFSLYDNLILSERILDCIDNPWDDWDGEINIWPKGYDFDKSPDPKKAEQETIMRGVIFDEKAYVSDDEMYTLYVLAREDHDATTAVVVTNDLKTR